MTTDISICSRALMLLGAGSISSFDEGTDRAQIVSVAYPGLRDALLSKYAWDFLKVKKKLTRDASNPIGQWAYSYIIPGEAIAGAPAAVFFNTQGKLAASCFEIVGRRLYTDEAEVWVDQVEQKPESEWPAYFQQAVVYALCAEIAFAITDQAGVADHWQAKAFGSPSENGLGGAYGDAMTLDAQGDQDGGVRSDAFVQARYGSWGSAYDFQWPGVD